MTSIQFAIVGVRVLGVAAIAGGSVFAGSSGVMCAFGMFSLTNPSASDLSLHDTYYVISDVQYAWLIPGAVSVVVGVLLLITSRSLGRLLARGTDSER
jgi:hypothetical protein